MFYDDIIHKNIDLIDLIVNDIVKLNLYSSILIMIFEYCDNLSCFYFFTLIELTNCNYLS